MNEFIGTIRLFAGPFAPEGWAFCDGSVLQIRTNTPLYSVIGNNFGGDGLTTFALPDLRSRVPIGVSNTPSPLGFDVSLGLMGGEETHTLNTAEIPGHSHAVKISSANSSDGDAEGPNAYTLGVPGIGSSQKDGSNLFTAALGFNTVSPNVALDAQTVSFPPANDNPAHENRQPFMALNYIICVQGIFPPH